MRVDSHLHIGLGLDERALLGYLDAHRFDACWLLSWEEVVEAPWPYEELGVDAIAALHAAHPDRVVPMYAPDPRRPDAGQRLRRWVDRGFRGCAELKAPLPWQAPEVRRLLDTVADLSLPLVFHMEVASTRVEPLDGDGRLERLAVRLLSVRRLGPEVHHWLNWLWGLAPPLRRWRDRRSYHFPGYLVDFASLAQTLAAYPGVRFVAHGPMWWQHLAPDVAPGSTEYPRGPVSGDGLVAHFLERFDNLYADLSGFSGINALRRDRAYSQRLLERFSEKLLFGSDNHEPGAHLELVASLGLSAATRRRVLGDNALALVG